jgi:hypothetical protein
MTFFVGHQSLRLQQKIELSTFFKITKRCQGTLFTLAAAAATTTT